MLRKTRSIHRKQVILQLVIILDLVPSTVGYTNPKPILAIETRYTFRCLPLPSKAAKAAKRQRRQQKAAKRQRKTAKVYTLNTPEKHCEMHSMLIDDKGSVEKPFLYMRCALEMNILALTFAQNRTKSCNFGLFREFQGRVTSS